MFYNHFLDYSHVVIFTITFTKSKAEQFKKKKVTHQKTVSMGYQESNGTTGFETCNWIGCFGCHCFAIFLLASAHVNTQASEKF